MKDFFSNPFEKKPWMYTKPVGEKLSKSWLTEWQRYILEYCEINRIYLITKNSLKQKDPFNRIDLDSFNSLFDYMFEQEYIVDWGDGLIRVYWKSNYSWSNELYNKSKSLKRDIIYGLDTLGDIAPEMLEIPKKDIENIYQILVNSEKARWVEKDKLILKII